MQSEVLIITTKIIMLGLLGLLGFAAGKKHYLPKGSGVVISKVVIKVTAPILIFLTLANREFKSEDIFNGLFIYLTGIVFIILGFLVSVVVSKRLHLYDSVGNIYRMQSMFGNVVFLAFPLLKAVFGDKGIAYAIFFNLANDTVLWTLGIYLVNRHNTKEWKDNLKHLVNGNTIAFVLGIICVAVNLQALVSKYHFVKDVYSFVFDTFNPLGATTTPLSMLFIGLILAETKINDFSDMKKRYPILVLSFFKLIFMPLVALGSLFLLGGLVNPFVKSIIVLQLAMPCATIVPALAAQYESDYKFATECVFFTTLMGVVTLPVMVGVLQLMGWS